jgi:hypothetical protein
MCDFFQVQIVQLTLLARQFQANKHNYYWVNWFGVTHPVPSACSSAMHFVTCSLTTPKLEGYNILDLTRFDDSSE